jgi:hypothetical protein
VWVIEVGAVCAALSPSALRAGNATTTPVPAPSNTPSTSTAVAAGVPKDWADISGVTGNICTQMKVSSCSCSQRLPALLPCAAGCGWGRS